jgi:nucleoside-diphosphate-sugar epimerase
VQFISLASSRPRVLNLTGPEKISVRWVAKEFGKLFGVKPVLKNSEEKTALLNNASSTLRVFGRPRVSLEQMMVWIAHWLKAGGKSLNKPTHFQERAGRF